MMMAGTKLAGSATGAEASAVSVKKGLERGYGQRAVVPGKREATVVAFDTNMLLNIARFKVDVFREARNMFGRVEFIVPAEAVRELDALAVKGKRFGKEARVAKMAMGAAGIKVLDFGQKTADKALLLLAPDAVIATNDKELKDSVREMSGRVLILRQRKFLELD